jgi:hypothetical protein
MISKLDGGHSCALRPDYASALANDLEVRLPAIDERPDPDIARDAIAAITNELPIFLETIKGVVKEG